MGISRRVPNLIAVVLLLTAGDALALPGTTPAVARLYASASPTSKVLATLPAKTPITIKACSGGSKGWCTVTAIGRSGWIPRAQVKANGNCAALRAVGLGDLRPGEASYNGNRDRDGDGLGCDKAT